MKAGLANILTGCRIVCGLLLLCTPVFSPVFYTLYLLGGLTDAIDGTVARALGTASDFGAKLDTFADMVFFLSALGRVLTAARLPGWLLLFIAAIALVKAVNLALGYLRSRQFVTVHSAANRLCGAAVFALIPVTGLLPRQWAVCLTAAVCCLCTAAAVLEGYSIRKYKA